MYVSVPFVHAPTAYYYTPPFIPLQMSRPRNDDSYEEDRAESSKRQRRSASPPHASPSQPSPPVQVPPSLHDPAAAAAAARPPCFDMLVSGSCDTVDCLSAHHLYGAALLASMSHQPPTRLPELHDGLTPHFRPAIFEEAIMSPFHTAAAAHIAESASDRRSTAVLPLPITRELLHIYRSAGFMAELLSFSRLSASDARLVLRVDEARVSSTDCLYGFIILAGSFECVQLGIGAVVSAVEGATHKPQSLPSSPPTPQLPHLPPPPAVSASSNARASSWSSPRSAPSPPPLPPRPPAARGAPVPPCMWRLRRNKKCFSTRCFLPDESHGPYSSHFIRCLDTAPRLFSAVPAFTADFVFVLCRLPPSADSPTFLCSLCVPNEGGTRGYIVGRQGKMQNVLEQAAGTRITCGRPSSPADELLDWMTVRARGTIEQVDMVVEGITYLVEAQPDASVDRLADHLQRFKQQRTKQEQRPMLWSLLSRGMHSARLDSLLAGDAPQPQSLTHSQPQPQPQPQPPAPTRDRRGHHPEREKERPDRAHSSSSSSSERREERSEPCPNSMSGFGCWILFIQI